VGFNRNIPDTKLSGHHLPQEYLQSQHQSLHGCGVNHIRTCEMMSLLSQHETYRDFSDIKLIEFSQRTNVILLAFRAP
jgi:hypothetical protein